MANPAEPENPRQLGRSRPYTATDVPERLRRWHAPRVNRWERLCLTAGTLAIERHNAAGVTGEELATGNARWFAPGQRWRLANLSTDARFDLEVHAETQDETAVSPNLRSALLDAAERVAPDGAGALFALIQALAPGERRIITGRFAAREALTQFPHESNGTLSWHPLAADADGFTALIARGERVFGLADYLGHDHAVIEAALAGALRGKVESARWLHATLERHLHIEEELLFPAYLSAGGREAWVRGLRNEHRYLRQYVNRLEQADGRRKFLRLLDGHDEKEERVVYPDILVHLGDRAETLLPQLKAFPIPSEDT